MNDNNRLRKWTIIDNETLNKAEIEASLNNMNQGLDIARRTGAYIFLLSAVYIVSIIDLFCVYPNRITIMANNIHTAMCSIRR